MSGVTPLVDTLLATRLGQRVDLVPLKAQAEIAGPGAVANVEKVDNDIRLPSREALRRELGVGLAGRDGVPASPAPARDQGAVTLSAAARTVSALLKLPMDRTPAVRGQAPLQPDMRTPAVPVLAAALARTVAESGLFYESHLQQFTAGQRTLAQLAREPQAGLALPAAAAQPPDVSPPLSITAVGSTLASLALLLEGMAALPPAPPVPPAATEAGPVPETPEAAAPPTAGRGEAQAPGASLATPLGKAGQPEPAGQSVTYGPSGLPEPVQPSPHDFSLPDAELPAAGTAPVDSARAGHPAAAIHPEALGLVRQQLDMLAQPVFRWSGEGWPGVPMDWDIRQEPEEGRERQAGEGGAQTAPAAWVTRMRLQLPRLGTLDVQLGLKGTALQLRLDASRDGTAAVLSQAGDQLSRRLQSVGLALADLRIGGAAGMAEPAHPADPGGKGGA
ncbi:Flagellar hook-length control protein FliK [Polaromonas sp. CF318]|uniref:flagellar hook-length control protein FliK n=1 Tax=Polaromonas sp. CF318 TaxID=1144318 RepID=UPI000270F91B|nr:flagellar hook-length control protein FliK [Polaromonas sp. CF318]EJL91016.1 Flagellar hook-length control protein FliK [Polaromonas sp. CF318]